MDYAPVSGAQEPITLAFADLEPAIEFYETLFGFVPESDEAGIVLKLPLDGYRHIALRITDEPGPLDASGMVLLLQRPEEVLDLYLLALLQGVPTTHLTTGNGLLRTSMTDPAGHVIQIEARQSALCESEAERRRHCEHERPVARPATAQRSFSEQPVVCRQDQPLAVGSERWRGSEERSESAGPRRLSYRGRRLGSGDE